MHSHANTRPTMAPTLAFSAAFRLPIMGFSWRPPPGDGIYERHYHMPLIGGRRVGIRRRWQPFPRRVWCIMMTMMVQHIIKLAMGMVDCVVVMMQCYYYYYYYRCYFIYYRSTSIRVAYIDVIAIEMSEQVVQWCGSPMMGLADNGHSVSIRRRLPPGEQPNERTYIPCRLWTDGLGHSSTEIIK